MEIQDVRSQRPLSSAVSPALQKCRNNLLRTRQFTREDMLWTNRSGIFWRRASQVGRATDSTVPLHEGLVMRISIILEH